MLCVVESMPPHFVPHVQRILVPDVLTNTLVGNTPPYVVAILVPPHLTYHNMMVVMWPYSYFSLWGRAKHHHHHHHQHPKKNAP